MIIELAHKILSNTFIMYFKAHSYHWNVEGNDWYQYHNFFGGIYNELWAAIDLLAEHIRILGDYGPYSLTKMYAHKTIAEDIAKPINTTAMLKNLLIANSIILMDLHQFLEALETAKQPGFANLITDRITAHEKHGYMLQSSLNEPTKEE